VPVEEYLVFDNNVYNASSSSSFYKTATQLNLQSQHTQVSSQIRPEAIRVITHSQHPEFGSSLVNAVVSLAYETASAGYGALVFCSSRVGCETDAQLISRVMPRPEELSHDIVDKREELLSELRTLTIGLDSVLEKTIPVGVAFHRGSFTS
jgi:replicative superfamily II helicase